MGFLQNLWFIIKVIFQNWILPFVYVPLCDFSKCNVVKYSRHTKNEKKNSNDDDDMGDHEGGDNNINGGDLPGGLRRDRMPRHVAVILDGNRRWATERGLGYVEGYEAGVGAMKEFVEICRKWKIPVLSLFTFSYENWLRPKEQVEFLMKLFETTLKDDRGLGHRSDGRISIIGDKSLFSTSLQDAIKKVEEETKDNTEFHVILAMSYSGQNDITQACKSIANKVKDGVLEAEDVTESLIQQQLATNITDIPNPDLLIRTSGELRISNYYLWQSAYTEMYFTDIHWPDFGEDSFVEALRSFQQRGRRFGKK